MTGLPDARTFIVVRVVLGDGFGLDVVRVVLGDGFGLNVTPALGGGERVGAKEGRGLFASCPFVVTWCPARELWLMNPAVKLDCARGVLTPGRPKVVQDLEGLAASRGPFFLLLFHLHGHSH